MALYTPPSLSAVDFALTAYTPPDLTPATQALASYTPPALAAVDFALVSYTPPTYPYVGWELLPSTPSFPTQYSGFRIEIAATAYDLCLVAVADAPTGMGGQPRIYRSGTAYTVYLVETTDPDASPLRMRTTTGTKAVRLKT